jgi:hypothetical protein
MMIGIDTAPTPAITVVVQKPKKPKSMAQPVV